MWFEILPSLGIIVGALAFPHISSYYVNYILVGNMFRRNMESMEERLQYLRDRRLTNNPYKIQGLDAIPDESEETETVLKEQDSSDDKC
ncbi:unnamed protein product [Diabrotica balteata]|uniref:NADH dehydrogenase [ubiquinone] 1 alpha subcomplex subunit 1 n=1 Tax=Diabrotica balteata TaxID=107213 RepID=A0A9N9T1Y8_DIABA|nr:unnamed protein product [Diabrotica balteata]